MPRPIFLGVVGDSAAGKTTLTRGIVRLLGEDQVTRIAADDYHRYDRAQRAERGLTPLDPACNYIDILEQHLRHLRTGEAVLKPVYRHQDGTFGEPRYVQPATFMVVEGLLGFHTAHLATDWADSVVLEVLFFTGPLTGKRYVDVSENSLYWYFVVAAWVPIYFVIYWGAR